MSEDAARLQRLSDDLMSVRETCQALEAKLRHKVNSFHCTFEIVGVTFVPTRQNARFVLCHSLTLPFLLVPVRARR